MVDRPTDLDSFSEGIRLFYQLNTFYFAVPTHLIQFFTDINWMAVRRIRSYELTCIFENKYEKPILDLDVLTWTLDRYLPRGNVKVKLEMVPECINRPFSKPCKQKTVEALGRFLTLRKLRAAVVIMPHGFEQVMQKTMETLGPHISFEFREERRQECWPVANLDELMDFLHPAAHQVLLLGTPPPPSAHQ
jgi:hypothetical protein